ncbi:MAG: hypothetical protein ACKPER_08610 [Dolichospermum sp.]
MGALFVHSLWFNYYAGFGIGGRIVSRAIAQKLIDTNSIIKAIAHKLIDTNGTIKAIG